MHSKTMWRFCQLWVAVSVGSGLFAQSVWQVPEVDREILIDGFLDDWKGTPEIVLAPGGAGLDTEGGFSEEDVRLRLMALWDKEHLYLAAEWHDNRWDTERVARRDAVWVDSNKRRRDRMLFFDNLKFHIRESDYDYTLWIAPRISDEGPYYWCRLLEGYKGMERATSAPMISTREHVGYATLEVILLWDQLRIKAKDNLRLPLTLILADSDLPGVLLDSKVKKLKSLSWKGRLQLVE